MEEDTDKEKEIKDFSQNDPYKESKSLIKGFVIIVGIFLVLSNTIPSYDLHKITISKHMSMKENYGRKVVGNNKGDEGFRNLIDKGVKKLFDLYLWGGDFRVDDYKICSVGSVLIDGKRSIISVGIIGKVFVLYENIVSTMDT